jgi:uncharacterized surface protein with fasciclin (FAS1) repeats
MRTLAADPELSTLYAALTAAGLDRTGEVLAGPGPLTLFAPTNDAFRQLPADALTSLHLGNVTKEKNQKDEVNPTFLPDISVETVNLACVGGSNSSC